MTTCGPIRKKGRNAQPPLAWSAALPPCVFRSLGANLRAKTRRRGGAEARSRRFWRLRKARGATRRSALLAPHNPGRGSAGQAGQRADGRGRGQAGQRADGRGRGRTGGTDRGRWTVTQTTRRRRVARCGFTPGSSRAAHRGDGTGRQTPPGRSKCRL